MPKKAHHRKPKRPDATPRLISFLMRFRGLSRAKATSAAARARQTGAEPDIMFCAECGDELYRIDPANPLPLEARADATAAHARVCGEHAA